jgi:hypothetical protein
MRLLIWSKIATLICALTVSLQSPLFAAENGGASYSIRLTSATEPVRESTSSTTASQDPPPAIEQSPSASTTPQANDQPPRAAPPITGPSSAPARAEQPPINRPRMPAGFYPSEAARAVLSQMPGPVPVQSAPRPQPTHRGGKPFQAVPTQPAISPYLYLNAGTTNASPMTNYFAFVRPQLDQQESSRQQQREIQQLRSQLQKVSSAGGAPQQSGAPSAAAHYMDTAQFYRGLQR